MKSSKIKGCVWAVIALFLGCAATFGLPFLARHVPWSVEKRLATLQKGFPEAEICNQGMHQEAAALFAKTIQRVYPIYPSDSEFPVKIRLVRGKTVNAFAFLAGEIFVYEGLLKQTESAEELAGILAHEIEHVKRRHIIQGAFTRVMTAGALKLIFSGPGTVDPKLSSMLLHLRFSREQELEADKGALLRLHDARVDTSGIRDFFERAKNSSSLPAILSDHPDNGSRFPSVGTFGTVPSVPIMSKAEWALVKTMCR